MRDERIAFIANGVIEKTAELTSELSAYPYLVAVDGGLNACYSMGLTPQLIVGDLDSADPEILKHFSEIPKKTFPTDKDKTDLEIALEEIDSSRYRLMTVFGGLGGRIDHELFNINLLSLYPGKLLLESEHQKLFVVDKQVELSLSIGQTLSLIPLNGPVTGVTTKGLKWELNHTTLDKHFMGISNLSTTANVFISAVKGDLLCVVQKKQIGI
jgi:thiamine pyrophosphokinase